MPIAELKDYPTDPEQLKSWSFIHAAHHRDIIRVIFETQGDVLDEKILDPFDPWDLPELQSWLNAHQDMHSAMNAALGLAEYPLWDVDWTKREDMIPWIGFHANEHILVGDLLNLG